MHRNHRWGSEWRKGGDSASVLSTSTAHVGKENLQSRPSTSYFEPRQRLDVTQEAYQQRSFHSVLWNDCQPVIVGYIYLENRTVVAQPSIQNETTL